MVTRAARAVNGDGSPKFLNLKRAGDYLGVNPKTLARAIDAGDLPCLRIGGQVLIPLSALEPRYERAEEDSAA